jgi:hypothetical protein
LLYNTLTGVGLNINFLIRIDRKILQNYINREKNYFKFKTRNSNS